MNAGCVTRRVAVVVSVLIVPTLAIGLGPVPARADVGPEAVAAAAGERILVRSDGYAVQAGAGQANRITLSVSGGALLIQDAGVASFAKVPSTCTRLSGSTAAATCPLRDPASGGTLVSVTLGDLDDTLDGSGLPATVALGVATGTGSNTVVGGAGADRITGGTVAGGHDVLRGGDGDDLLFGGDGDDEVRGELGDDVVQSGGGAANTLYGGDGDDILTGGDGADTELAGPGADYLIGKRGNDVMSGDAGDDRLYGDPGDDQLTGGPGSDQLQGLAGDDTLRAKDGTADTVLCGDDTDSAQVDAGLDSVSDSCETVH